MFSHARPISRSSETVQAAMTISAATNSLTKMRLFTALQGAGELGSYARRGGELGDFEAIARAPHRLQVARIVGILFDFLTYAAHVDINRARRDVMSVAPDCIKKLVAGKDASGMACKIFQQTELGGRGLRKVAAHGERHAAAVDLDVAGLDDRGRERTLKAPQHGADA